MSQKHIVIDARIISSSTGRYVERLLHYLQDVDTYNRYTVLVPQKDAEYWVPKNPNFTLEISDVKSFTFNEQLRFYFQLRRLNADLIHFCSPQQPVLYRGKKVTTIHDLTLIDTYNPDKNWFIYKTKQYVGKFVFKYIARSSTAVITPTDHVRNDVIRRYNVSPEKVIRTYEAAGARTSDVSPYPLKSDKFIMFVGQQSAYKNINRLCDAHQKILIDHPTLLLVLVGKIDSSAKMTQSYVKKNNYKNVVFTGYTEDDQLTWLYKHTSAYVFPSLMEGFGLPGLEAMAQGAPVVSSNTTCLPEVYSEAAHYFNPTDTVAMVSAITEVLTNNILRKSLIKKGFDQVRKYSWQSMAEETHSVYLYALNQNKNK